MPRFAEDKLAELKQAADIVSIIGDYLPLKRAGRSFKGLCPFHDDHNPSLTVNPERQTFKCWACGAGGDVIRFVELRERVDFPEAVEILAQKLGIDMGPATPSASSGGGPSKLLLYEAVAWACQQYEQALADSPAAQVARDYVQKRKISPESVRRFRLGYAPAGWDWLLERARGTRFSPAVLVAAGLAVPRPNGQGFYDRFHGEKVGRLIFPICDSRQRPIGFGARTLADEVPKYLNSPAGPLFDKSRCLYALHLARPAAYKERRLIVMEGYTDCIMAHQMGLTATVGTLGTALTRAHVLALKQYADEVVLVFDGDEAGRKAAERSIDLFLLEELHLRVLVLPGELDPCDFLIQQGAEEFGRLVHSAPDAVDFKLDCARRAHDWNTIEGRRQALDRVLSALAQVPAHAPASQQIKVDMILDRLARELGVEERTIRRRLAELHARTRPAARPREAAALAGPPEKDEESAARAGVERELVEIMLAEPSYVASIREVVALDDFTSPVWGRIAAAAYAIHEQGRPPTHEAILATLQDGRLTEAVVDAYEAGLNKGQLGQRLEAVMRTIREDQRRRRAAQLARQLQQPRTDEGPLSENDVLRQLQKALSGK